MPSMPNALAPDTLRPRLFAPLFVLLTASTWAALWVWDAGPYSRYLHHADWTDARLVDTLCQSLPGGGIALAAFLHSVAWLLMIAAMMLPSTFPLLDMFRRLTARRDDKETLFILLLSGYTATWVLFGLFAHLSDAALHALASRSQWGVVDGWLVGTGVLALAGAYQFSRLKYQCLDKCRSPLMFVTEHWRGTHQRRASFLLGVRHGAFCVGCCWALMLLMFAIGTGSIGWMLGLGAVMAAEKNLRWGRHLGKPVGVVLLGWAAWIAVQHVPIG
jgi:predicted metal-binding membrane protein